MSDSRVNRRGFLKTSSIAAAGMAAGIAAGQAAQGAAETPKILNHNPKMEYRPCGKTGMNVSCVAMGGHWKRIDTIIGESGKDWLGTSIDNPDFQKNRHDVVTR